MFLFDLDADYHELHNLKDEKPAEFTRMLGLLNTFLASVNMSQHEETKCAQRDHGPDTPHKPAGPAPPPRTDCTWTENTGQKGSDIDMISGTASKEECCARCWANPACKASDFHGKICHLKGENTPIARHDGSVSCAPKRDLDSNTATDTMECGASTVCQGPL